MTRKKRVTQKVMQSMREYLEKDAHCLVDLFFFSYQHMWLKTFLQKLDHAASGPLQHVTHTLPSRPWTLLLDDWHLAYHTLVSGSSLIKLCCIILNASGIIQPERGHADP